MQRQRQRLEARARLVATATATFHFISFLRLVPFRFSGFAEWLRGAVAEIRNRIKMRQRLERQLCGNEIQMYLGLPLTDCLFLALLGVAHLPVACRMCRLVRDAFISYISFHAACVWHQIQLSLMCSLCVCLCVSVSPNWYETLLLLVCSKLNWQRVLPRIQQSTIPSTHNPQYNPTRLTTTKLKHKNLKLSL